MNHFDVMQQSLDEEHEFHSEFLAFFPASLSPADMLGHAIDVLVADCNKVKHVIWKVPHREINRELLDNESLNRSERMLAEMAISLWTSDDAARINLWDFLHKADFKANQNFLRAMNILFHWYASLDRHSQLKKKNSPDPQGSGLNSISQTRSYHWATAFGSA